MNNDRLQNELLSISHHISDIRKAAEDESLDPATSKEMILTGLSDVEECLDRLREMLPKQMSQEFTRMAENIIRNLARTIE